MLGMFFQLVFMEPLLQLLIEMIQELILLKLLVVLLLLLCPGDAGSTATGNVENSDAIWAGAFAAQTASSKNLISIYDANPMELFLGIRMLLLGFLQLGGNLNPK